MVQFYDVAGNRTCRIRLADWGARKSVRLSTTISGRHRLTVLALHLESVPNRVGPRGGKDRPTSSAPNSWRLPPSCGRVGRSPAASYDTQFGSSDGRSCFKYNPPQAQDHPKNGRNFK